VPLPLTAAEAVVALLHAVAAVVAVTARFATFAVVELRASPPGQCRLR